MYVVSLSRIPKMLKVRRRDCRVKCETIFRAFEERMENLARSLIRSLPPSLPPSRASVAMDGAIIPLGRRIPIPKGRAGSFVASPM